MWADINTKALQGSLFYKMRARLMGVPEDYDNDIERQNTHTDLLLQEVQECAIWQETKDLLHKAGAIRKLVAATRKSLPNAKRKTQAAVAALLLQSMAKQNKRLSSNCRSVLGGKGNALHTIGKGMCTGRNDIPVDGWTTVRRACIQSTEWFLWRQSYVNGGIAR